MRISFAIEQDNNLLWLNRRKESTNQLSNSISSGTKLASPSDDPVAWARSADLKQGLREYDSILGNLDFATGWNQAADAALTNVSDLISQARQVGISANGPSGEDQKDALAAQLDGIISQMLQAANSQYSDQYIFAGTATASAPFSLDDSTGEVTYSGDSGQVQVRTDRGANGVSTVNQTGTDVFSFASGGSDLNVIHEIWELKQAVSAGDSDAVSAKLNTLDDAFQSVSSKSTTTGARLAALENQKSTLNTLKTVMTSRLSDLQDIDLADAVIQLQQQQTAYEASLKVISLTNSLNLASLLTT